MCLDHLLLSVFIVGLVRCSGACQNGNDTTVSSMRKLSNEFIPYCGVPSVDDPWEAPFQRCNAYNQADCATARVFQTGPCFWQDGGCTSEAVGEENNCPLVETQDSCERSAFFAIRSCQWYESTVPHGSNPPTSVPTDPPSIIGATGAPSNSPSPSYAPSASQMPTLVPSTSKPTVVTSMVPTGYQVPIAPTSQSLAAPFPFRPYCGLPDLGDPWRPPRRTCSLSDNKQICNSFAFFDPTSCIWRDGMCTSIDVSHEAVCANKFSEGECHEAQYVVWRPCVWYELLHYPSTSPSVQPTQDDSLSPSSTPTRIPTGKPTSRPSNLPSRFLSVNPTSSSLPSVWPTAHPTHTTFPSEQPTLQPVNPSSGPSMAPTMRQTTETIPVGISPFPINIHTPSGNLPVLTPTPSIPTTTSPVQREIPNARSDAPSPTSVHQITAPTATGHPAGWSPSASVSPLRGDMPTSQPGPIEERINAQRFRDKKNEGTKRRWLVPVIAGVSTLCFFVLARLLRPGQDTGEEGPRNPTNALIRRIDAESALTCLETNANFLDSSTMT